MGSSTTEDSGDKAKNTAAPEYKAPQGSRSIHSFTIGGKSFDYEAEADWIVLRKDEKPTAEMFYTRYFLVDGADRPLTFVFNGGPGASSVYLHLGAMGPRIVDFGPRGEVLPPPHKLVENPHTWLQFTDLVFIDPIGTGLSRMIPDEKKDADKKEAEGKKDVEYWQLKRDLESIGEFCRSFLSRFHRWESPVYIAGESYGGFRVAKLSRMLQKDYGIALCGAIIISPAMEFTLLDGSDYDALMWVDAFPGMAAAAAWHKRARRLKPNEDHQSYARRAGLFAVEELLPVLAAGELLGPGRCKRVYNAAADFIGLPPEIVRAKFGRITIDYFVKNLLRDRGLFLGLYDATNTVQDPYPDRDDWSGPDPTLHVVERVFASGINSHLRKTLKLDNNRDYALLSEEVNRSWKIDTRNHALESQIGATDDLRYGMSINPHMKVYLTHGFFDLVTPFFTAERLRHLMKLDDKRKERLQVKHYDGGHMFYTWKASREAFFADMKEFYASPLT
ncbi:MAG: peptidase S10 [Spirochaetes bacterium]|nr:peptidase S10 [Spirochaetota bacterium]MBU0954095.1 peptidase S10 [Spirochaetota bacterium]